MNIYYMISAVLILSVMGLYQDGRYSSAPEVAQSHTAVAEVARTE